MPEHTGKFVAYYRVSTKRQGASGLGLDAQRTAVAQYLNGGDWKLIGEFTEVESGKDDKNRPKLQEALHLCKVTGARLIIAKLDRLSRDVEFLAKLQKSSVGFTCADMPEANELVVGMMAVVAQDERQRISARIKAALGEIKSGRRETKSGRKLGPTDAGIAAIKRYAGNPLGAAGIKRKADAFAQDMVPIIADIRAAGITTQQGIAVELTRRGVRMVRGNIEWTQPRVGQLLKRIEALRGEASSTKGLRSK